MLGLPLVWAPCPVTVGRGPLGCCEAPGRAFCPAAVCVPGPAPVGPFAGKIDVRSVESRPGPAGCGSDADGEEIPTRLPVSGVFAGQSVARAKSASSWRCRNQSTYLGIKTRRFLYNWREERWSSKHRLDASHSLGKRWLRCSKTADFARQVLSLRL